MKVNRVTVDAPIRFNIDPKDGTDSAMNRRTKTEKVLKAHLFQLKSTNRWELIEYFFSVNKTCWYLQSVLHNLRWGIHDDGECGDEVNQEHDLHQDPLPASRHGHDNVVRH